MIQTVALSRLLPAAAGVYRHRLEDAPANATFVMNGFLDKDSPPPGGTSRCVFAGVSGPHFRRRQYLDWMRTSPFPIGARDPATMEFLIKAGLPSIMVGCATLTLPRYDGTRSGVYSVDYYGPGTRLSHRISRELSVERQWKAALEALDTYRRAEAVYTSRLHVALPCLAFGTPVWIAKPSGATWRPSRYSLLEQLEIPYETLITADVTLCSSAYLQFLEQSLSTSIIPGEPKMPSVPPDAGVPRWRFPWP
ncbi:MAG: polysaccharide pyruvyl transferase family protein [Acidobacteria bacterium]|nr:polysaccharide pyruvyl transferase family protein [Acidobacteriota bacterium]